jgi:hypothetical protein
MQHQNELTELKDPFELEELPDFAIITTITTDHSSQNQLDQRGQTRITTPLQVNVIGVGNMATEATEASREFYCCHLYAGMSLLIRYGRSQCREHDR